MPGVNFKNMSISQVLGILTLLAALGTAIGTAFTFYRDWDSIRAWQLSSEKDIKDLKESVGQIAQLSERIVALDSRMIKLDGYMEQRIGATMESARQERETLRENVVRLQSQMDFLRERIGELSSSQIGAGDYVYTGRYGSHRPRQQTPQEEN